MGGTIVTIIGVAAWAGAIVLIVRLRDSRWVPAPTSESSRLGVAVARVTGAVAAGLVAGVLVLGFGSRLLMRILAATSDSAQGRITEADEVIGEVTLEGTVGILLFVGVLGGLLGLALYALLRRWLPHRSLVAGIVTLGIGAGLTARPSGLLDPDSVDFELLEPTWLAVVLATGLLATFALLSAPLIDRWSARWPAPSLTPRGLLSMTPLVPLVLAPPVALVTAAVIAFRALLPAGGIRVSAAVERAVGAVLVVAAVVGTAWLGVTIVDLLG